MKENIDLEVLEFTAKLQGSFILFCQTFYPLVTGRPFILSHPPGRESHFITIARALTSSARLDPDFINLLINVPPGSGKSTLVALWVAWTMAQFPDSQYLYISYGFELAVKHTEFIRRVIKCPFYGKLFGVYIRFDMKSKDHFVNNYGGSVKAFGMSGPIVGQDGGLPGLLRFSGAILMDDLHKPDEAHSDTMRAHVIKNFQETISQRPRSPLVPMIFIGQRLHEDDLPAFLLSGKDERKWNAVVIKSIDAAGNALYPEVNTLQQLLEKKEKNTYTFHSQYQQEPVPAGGALFKEKDFLLLDEEPAFICTFITVDTAETSKDYNDASVFSFWGLYKVSDFGHEVDEYALHWVDCWEARLEPKDLESSFKSFVGECMLHKTKPRMAAIEKKSAGVTLCSVLEDIRGIEIVEVKRTKASGSKTTRYLEMQPIISSKLVTFTRYAKHAPMCIEHMLKITANMSHRHDDIADTCYDGVKLALIDKTLKGMGKDDDRSSILKNMASSFKTQLESRMARNSR